MALGQIGAAEVRALGEEEHALRLVAVQVRQQRDHLLHHWDILHGQMDSALGGRGSGRTESRLT